MYLVFIQEKGDFATSRFPKQLDALAYAREWWSRNWSVVVFDTDSGMEITFNKRRP